MPAFTVSVTYDIVTPESAEDGNVAESGFTLEDDPCTLREALDTLARYGPYDHIQHNGSHDTYYGADAEQNYRTGEATSYAVHVYGSEKHRQKLATLATHRRYV